MYEKFQRMIDEEFYSKTIGFLKELIKIPSVSGNEKSLARYIGTNLEKMGAEVVFQTVDEESENVIAVINGKEPGMDILLTGHLDTVPPMDGWNTNPFEPIEEDDKIYGLGSSDMKAGIAIALSLAEMFARNKNNFKGSLKIAFAADEERYSVGVKKLIEEMNMKADVAFMIEPEYYEAIVGAAGKMLIKVKVKGKASHAANPKQGINAIEEASKLVANLDKVNRINHEKVPYQPFVTFNIDGGYDYYSVTVPDYCEIIINKHTVPGESVELVLNQLAELKNSLGLKAEFDFEVIEPFYPPYAIDGNSEYLVQLKKVYKDIVGDELGIAYGSGVSDANCVVGLADITTINFGPSGGPIHSPNEWVSKEQIYNVLKIYTKLLSKYMF